MKKLKFKKRTWIIIICILLILMTAIFAGLSKKVEKDRINGNTSINQFASIKEMVTYMKCKYISEKESKTEGYDLDVYIELRYDLYTDNKSNETFFEQVVNNLAAVGRYKNLRIIDQKKDIKIEIKCSKENKSINEVKINDIQGYFEYMKSKSSIDNYKEEDYTKFNVNSQELKDCINNNWVTFKAKFGSKESSMNNYDIYFDEGIEVRNIGERVYNIVYNKKYANEVVDGIKVGSSNKDIIQALGIPTFGEEGLSNIGYIGKDFYIFFTDTEISVYRVDRNYNTDSFTKLVDEYIKTDDEKKFMNALTDIWPDYDNYDYASNYFTISYASKGIEISYNLGSFDGMKVYPNFSGKIYGDVDIKKVVDEKIQLPKRINAYLDEDLIYRKEMQRQEFNSDIYGSLVVDKEQDLNVSNKFGIINTENNKNSGKSNIKIISLDGEYPNFEFEKIIKMKSFLWLDDYKFVYSIENDGIYFYNILNKQNVKIVEGNEPYKLNTYKDNIISYDDNKKIRIE